MSRNLPPPKYVVEVVVYARNVYSTPMIWRKEYGRPNEKNLLKFVQESNESVKPGGVNAHLGVNHAIMKAKIRYNRSGGEVIATYNAPMFQVI